MQQAQECLTWLHVWRHSIPLVLFVCQAGFHEAAAAVHHKNLLQVEGACGGKQSLLRGRTVNGQIPRMS